MIKLALLLSALLTGNSGGPGGRSQWPPYQELRILKFIFLNNLQFVQPRKSNSFPESVRCAVLPGRPHRSPPSSCCGDEDRLHSAVCSSRGCVQSGECCCEGQQVPSKRRHVSAKLYDPTDSNVHFVLLSQLYISFLITTRVPVPCLISGVSLLTLVTGQRVATAC